MILVHLSVKERLHPEVNFLTFSFAFGVVVVVVLFFVFNCISLFILKDYWTIKLVGVCVDDKMLELELVLRD